MGSIYKNAACNIAATWAEDGDDGCFRRQAPRTLELKSRLGQSAKYRVDMATLYYDEIMEAPLNERGWVTQERFLAKRQLNFAKSQVYWECGELVASEQYPEGIPKRLRDHSPYNQAVSPTGKPTMNPTNKRDIREVWAALVDSYSESRFSELSDKMIALAGLAGEVRKQTNDTYRAGLWEQDLEVQLC